MVELALNFLFFLTRTTFHVYENTKNAGSVYSVILDSGYIILNLKNFIF